MAPFPLYFASLIGVPFENLQLAVSENNVFHCAFELNEQEHAIVHERDRNSDHGKSNRKAALVFEQLRRIPIGPDFRE